MKISGKLEDLDGLVVSVGEILTERGQFLFDMNDASQKMVVPYHAFRGFLANDVGQPRAEVESQSEVRAPGALATPSC